jgi:TolA-binding protein
MRSLTKCLVSGIIFLALSACVTTREQLNAEKGIGQTTPTDSGAPTTGDVKSVDLTPKISQPEVVKASTPNASVDTATGAPVTAPVTSPTTTQAEVSNTSGGSPMVLAPVVTKPKPAATPNPDLSSYSAEELRAEVANLSGKLEENEHNQQITEQTQAENAKKAQARIDELEKKLKELQPDAPTLPEGKTPFEAGKDDYIANNYDEAIVFLSQALAKSDTGKEAEEAIYLRGDCYFQKKQYNKAIVDFSQFPEKYPKSSYHPKALLRIAESFEATDRKDDAKAFYSDLLDKFPRTAEGKLAKKRLKAKK